MTKPTPMRNVPQGIQQLQRRAFLQRGAALSVAGSALPWALQMAAMGEAAAAPAPTDYKALVCVFLNGGNDYANTVVPYDVSNYNTYLNLRLDSATGGIATSRASLLPLSSSVPLPSGRQMALAPQLSGLRDLFVQNKMAVLLNIGTLVQPTTLAQYNAKSVPLPPKLFSHNDQQSFWQASATEGAKTGWGGRLGDLFLNSNANSTFTCMNVAGNAVFTSGQQAFQYSVGTAGAVKLNAKTTAFGSSDVSAALQSLTQANSTHLLEAEHTKLMKRAVAAEGLLTTSLATAPVFATPFGTHSLAQQLQMVAKTIAARQSLGAKRQVFFVQIGGFDLHDNLVANHPGLLANVSDAISSFYAATVQLGIQNNVTTFTASDFGRTLASNGDGSDHGWGSHHFVVGGAVQGGRFYGQLPATAVNGPDDVGQGRLLPTTSVDQLAANLATWFGVPNNELGLVLPNAANFDLTALSVLG